MTLLLASSGSASTLTRPLAGVDGSLVAVESATGAVVQLTNLQGDVVATTPAATSAVTSVVDASVFGIPVPGTTRPRYGWLGAKTRPSDQATGITLMGQRLYNAQSGPLLQVDPLLAAPHPRTITAVPTP